jgi:phosphoserine phosphatase RsbU/P
MTSLRSILRSIWQHLSRPDLFAIAITFLGALCLFLRLSGGVFSFLKYAGILAGIYLMIRFLGWWRSRLLWSLRNRLIVAYLFIALVPVLLVTLLAVQAALLLYSQLGGYLLYEDMQKRVQLVADGASQIASALSTAQENATPQRAEQVITTQEHQVYDARLPGLTINFTNDPGLLKEVAGEMSGKFAGLLQEGNTLFLDAMQAVPTSRGTQYVELRVPVTPEFLATLAPDLGHVLVDVVEPRENPGQPGITFRVGNKEYVAIREIHAASRVLQPPTSWLDREVTGFSRFEALRVSPDGSASSSVPVVASFSARPSQLNARMFSSIGELSYLNFLLFFALAGVLLVVEVAALITGIVMTRQITKAVNDLYKATQFVQARDFTHRVKIASRDQLGVLGESFNLMTESVNNLIEEQKQRQKLENEISIAREVQNQLFPQRLPEVPGVEIEAICTAARMVSGDYYDFIQLTPTCLAIAIADISGKGISAALLMASLQASLRSLILADGSGGGSTAELVARLNRHLVRNTGDDRFATFFIAVYDSATRVLRYTNAGHLPTLCICDGTAVHLDKGGIVLGVVEDYSYEEGMLVVPPDALLIGYSDGLVEPENVYGEEFGIPRLKAAAVRLQHESPKEVAAGLMRAAEEWASTPEQADDMTVIVARLS